MKVEGIEGVLRETYDLRSNTFADRGGAYRGDFHSDLARLRETGPVHPGTVAELLGHPVDHGILYEERPFFSVFSWDGVNGVLRDSQTYSSSIMGMHKGQLFGRSILEMDDDEHRRYRALVQPAFTKNRAEWWIQRWIGSIVDELVGGFEHDGRADLNIQLCALLPLLTITGSFGVDPEDSLDFKAAVDRMLRRGADITSNLEASRDIGDRIVAIVERRRQDPQDDLITILSQERLVEDGVLRALTDDEINGFSRLLLAAGSGTTWRQLGIVLYCLLIHPDHLRAVREDRALVRSTIEEAMRWEPNDTIFWRLVTRDVELEGVALPKGAVLELSLAAANRDPSRWERPDEFDPGRPLVGNIAFGAGPHVCLGMHVARAEMSVALEAVLDRLPNLALADDAGVRILGIRERAVSTLPVVFG